MESLTFPLLPVRFPVLRTQLHLEKLLVAPDLIRPIHARRPVMLRSYSIAIEYFPTIQDTSWHVAVR